MAPVLAADDGTAVGLDCWLGSSADTESVDHGGEVMQSEQCGLSVEGWCPASILLRMWMAVEARQRGGVSV